MNRSSRKLGLGQGAVKNPAGEGGVELAAFSRLIISVFRLNGRIIEWGDLLGAPLGLSSARWQVLGAILMAGEALTAPAIARAMGVTRQGAQKQLNALLARGLVEQKPNPRHERSYLYALTPQGQKAADQIGKIYARRLGEATQGISAQALAEAQALADRLIGNLESLITREPLR